MYIMDLNNNTIVRNVIRFLTFKNITIKYKNIVTHKETLEKMIQYEKEMDI